MKDFHPDFLALSRIEEDLLVSRLDAARKAIAHAAEKGRSLEAEVTTLLRSFLPEEYALTTGFVVYHGDNGPSLSPQLDVIIYDHIRSGPVARLATCDVLPLEAVFAYVEVKASLQSTSNNAQELAGNSIEKCLKTNQQLRRMRNPNFWAPDGFSSGRAQLMSSDWMPIRSFIFTFEVEGDTAKSPDLFAQRIADYSARLGHPVHLHGVFVAGRAFYATQAIDVNMAKSEDAHNVTYTTDQPLAAFKKSLIHSLARFPRFPEHWTPAIDRYVQDKTTWKLCAPRQG